MSHVCGRSWRITAHFHFFCTLARNHAERCSCDGRIAPDGAIFYEDDTELHAFLQKQAQEQAREDARKSAKRDSGQRALNP